MPRDVWMPGLSTLAPVRALRARTLEQAWARRAVDEGVRSCPRAGCGEICMSGSMSGMWKRSHGRTSEAPPDEEAGTDMFEPKATAPHLDSTATTFVITYSPSRSNRRDGLTFFLGGTLALTPLSAEQSPPQLRVRFTAPAGP